LFLVESFFSEKYELRIKIVSFLIFFFY